MHLITSLFHIYLYICWRSGSHKKWVRKPSYYVMYFIHTTHKISIYSTLWRYMGKRNIAAKTFPPFTGRLFISRFSGWQLLNKQQPTKQVNIFSVLSEHSWCAALGETLDTDPASYFWHFSVSVSHYTPAPGRPAHLFTHKFISAVTLPPFPLGWKPGQLSLGLIHAIAVMQNSLRFEFCFLLSCQWEEMDW